MNVQIDHTIEHVLNNYFKKIPNSILICNFEYPLLKASYIDSAISSLFNHGSDSVISVVREQNNLYHDSGNGLSAFTLNKELRLERDIVYRETGGLHIVRGEYFHKNHTLTSNLVSYVEIDNLSSQCAVVDISLEDIGLLLDNQLS